MAIFEINPLVDPRWPEFLAREPRSAVFHSPGWLRALAQAYGYRPFVLTTSSPGSELQDGIVLCEVNSWLTGRRISSLPFSDHCEPLIGNSRQLPELLDSYRVLIKARKLDYIELRPETLDCHDTFLAPSTTYCLHKIDLRGGEDDLFRRLHKDSIQRKIQRARREGLVYERGDDEILLRKLYSLLVKTRKRHGLPPQPFSWYSNLLTSMAGNLQIRIVSKDRQPVAGMLTLNFKSSVVYKYGGSDATFNNLGGMPFLFWMTMTESRREGLTELDLGRSDCDNEGLVTFKNRLGGIRSQLTYWRCSRTTSDSVIRFSKGAKLLGYMPEALCKGMGVLLYRHLG